MHKLIDIYYASYTDNFIQDSCPFFIGKHVMIQCHIKVANSSRSYLFIKSHSYLNLIPLFLILFRPQFILIFYLLIFLRLHIAQFQCSTWPTLPLSAVMVPTASPLLLQVAAPAPVHRFLAQLERQICVRKRI